MNFQSLPTPQPGAQYLDTAIRAAKKYVQGKPFRAATRLDLVRQKEQARLDVLTGELAAPLNSLVKAYPSFDNLPEFYTQLVRATLDKKATVAALASVNWGVIAVRRLRVDYAVKVRGARSVPVAMSHTRAFLGRLGSIMKRLDPHLRVLHETRQVMRAYPDLNDGPTVAITGFPNVGKSTLLSKLCGASPRIAPYAFTTTTLNVGLLRLGARTVQLIDTPGTLNREAKMNNVERVAWLALKYAAHAVVFVADPTEPYPEKDQLALYRRIKELDKPTMVYLSKTDLVQSAAFAAAFEGATDSPSDVKTALPKLLQEADRWDE